MNLALHPLLGVHRPQEFGLQPQQFVDVLALAGDASGEARRLPAPPPPPALLATSLQGCAAGSPSSQGAAFRAPPSALARA